jgi:hypothetical protein
LSSRVAALEDKNLEAAAEPVGSALEPGYL